MIPPSKNNPLVSVIVPVYNAARWLPELFGSLRSQTYGNMEVILVDDGSTDTSAADCLQLSEGDPRFRIVRKPNGGLSSARNFGLEDAGGEWIFFIDADDMVQPQALERLVATALTTHADIVVGSFENTSRMSSPPATRSPRILAPHEAVAVSLYQTPPMNHAWGTLYSRGIFFPDGPRFTEGLWYEDLDLFYRLFERASRVAYLPEKLYFYRKNPSSFINTVSPARFDALRVTDKIERYYSGTALAPAARDRRFSAHFNMLLLLLRNGSDYPDVFRKAWDVVKCGRREVLRNPRVRLKNKTGALLSYGGIPLLKLISKFY
jgi:exopolysaccharide biosynthesis protein, sugar transferase